MLEVFFKAMHFHLVETGKLLMAEKTERKRERERERERKRER